MDCISHNRRPLGTEEELLVFIWSSGPLQFVDASPALQPYSYFQYRVRAYNSKGSVLSQWTSARTLQAKPKDIAPPIVTPSGKCATSLNVIFIKYHCMNLFSIRLTSIGAYSVNVKWSEPGQPNGLISHYRLVYKNHQQDPTLNPTAMVALTVEVNANMLLNNYLGTLSFIVFEVLCLNLIDLNVLNTFT